MRIFNPKFNLLARCPDKRGFSFMEILVATIILLIGISGIMGMLFWGRSVLKQKENKARAMNIAYSIMEEFLAQSYDTLGTVGRAPNPPNPTLWAVDPSAVGTMLTETGTTDNIFDWNVTVTQAQMRDPEFPLVDMRVPFRQIEVAVDYPEESPREKGRIYNQQVRLVNMIPYPFMHALKFHLGMDYVPGDEVTGNWGQVGWPPLAIDIDFETRQNLQIIYNIATKIEYNNPANQVDVDANLETAVFLDGVRIATETGTNVLTQPLITSHTTFAPNLGVSAGPHTIEVRWLKDIAGGIVYRREANLIVLATEP